MGDFYLKYKEFNDPGVSRHVIKQFNGPYIEATPEIKVVDISSDDGYIVMASDGMWDFLGSKDVVELLKNKKNANVNEISQSLFGMVMAQAAKESNMSIAQAMNIPPGKRRNYYDDTTILVFDLKH